MALTNVPLMQGPRVALALTKREFDAIVAELGLESSDPTLLRGAPWATASA